MAEPAGESVAAFYANTYDVSVPDWPGEIDFYKALADEVKAGGGSLLEVACGTGRVAIRLAQDGTRVVGLDRSPHMLAVARKKSAGIINIRWVEADMRCFDLGEEFLQAIIPGHAFQNLNAAEDQLACLECIREHLEPDGMLAVHLDHQDLEWLGALGGNLGGVYEAAEHFTHPETGRQVQAWRAWWYERSTQTATVQTVWVETDGEGHAVDRWQTGPVRLHCVFRFEMEHLLGHAGFAVEALYGDFYRNPLTDESSDMIWLARKI